MQYSLKLILTILEVSQARAAEILGRSEQKIHEWYEEDRPIDKDQLSQIFSDGNVTLDNVLKQLDIKCIAASLLGCPHKEIESRCRQGSPITLHELLTLLNYHYLHLLYRIVDELELPQATVAELLGCARSNINSRYHKHSLITGYEIYRLYQHALQKGWHNKIGVLLPLIELHFPHLFQSERSLAELIPDIWQQVVVFVPTQQDAKSVQRSLMQDRRNTEKRRQIRICIPTATLFDDVRAIFEHELPLRFELIINQADNMNFASALMAFTIPDNSQQELLLLRPANAGFMQLAGEDLRVHREHAMKILADIHSRKSMLYGPVMVNSIGLPPRKPPRAAGSNDYILDFTGQLGGRYRLMVECDADDEAGVDNGEEQWRMRLTAEADHPDRRLVTVIDQTGRVVIHTQSDNLPWQGFWPDEGQPLRIHIDNLNLMELAAR